MWNGKCKGLCSILRGQRDKESDRVTERERERRRVRHGEIMPVPIREQRYVGEQTETKYLKF